MSIESRTQDAERGDATRTEPAPPVRERTPDARRLAEKLAVPGALVVAVVVFSVLLPGLFLTPTNIDSLVATQAVPLILALGVLLPLRCNYFDLSIAQVMVLAGVVTGALTVRSGWDLVPAVLVALACACACGVVNGVLTVYCGLNSFVVTLGTSSVIGGLLYAITDSQSIQPMPEALVAFTTDRFLGLPHLVWYAWLIAAALWVVLEFTPYGRYLLFVGGSRPTSELLGLRARRLGFTTYLAAALLAGFAGVLLAGSLGTVNPTIGAEFLLTPYTAAFLGAAAIQVGRFNVVGTIIAVYLVAVGQTGLILLGSPSWVSNVFEGAILVAAIGFSRLSGRRSRSAR